MQHLKENKMAKEDPFTSAVLSKDLRTIEQLAKEYLQSKDVMVPGAVIEFVDDVNGRAKQLRPIDALGNKPLNGKMVLPDPPTGKYHILINSKIVSYDILETIVHEFIHLFDYLSFADRHCNGDCLSIEHHLLFRPFYFYSEFRAKSYGLQGRMKHDCTDNIQFFKDRLVPYFKEKMHSGPSEYDLIRTLAEIHARSELMTEREISNIIQTIFQGYNLNIINGLFTYLSNSFGYYDDSLLPTIDSTLSDL
jgi:hypothetical protein